MSGRGGGGRGRGRAAGGGGGGRGGGRGRGEAAPPPQQQFRPVAGHAYRPAAPPPRRYDVPSASSYPEPQPPAVYQSRPAGPPPRRSDVPYASSYPETQPPAVYPSRPAGPPPRREAQPPAAYRRADFPSSSSSVPASLSEEVERRLNISDPTQSASSEASVEPMAIVPASAPQVSSKAVAYPRRPGFGTIGRPMLVRANHFIVSISDRNDLCHYDVAITPEVISKGVNRAIIRELVKQYSESHLGRIRAAYDGRKSLYTPRELPFSSNVFVVKLPNKEASSTRPEKEYKVAIKFATRHDLRHLNQFLQGRQLESPQEIIQVLDVVLRESPSKNYKTVVRSFYDAKFGRDDIGEGLEYWRGYYQSLRPTQMGLSLNIDISATSFYKAVPIIDFVQEYLNLREASRPLSDNDRIKIKKALRGVRIETTHMRNSIRRYMITGITAKPLSQLRFSLDDKGQEISVAQYFREKYNYPLRYTHWPCLQSGKDANPTYLPMEVCKIVEGQRFTKKLNERQVTSMLRATCKRPHERERSISEMVDQNRYSEDEFARDFLIGVRNQLAQVHARVLPPPKLKYNESGKEKMCIPSVGQWNMADKKMVHGGIVEYWTCLNLSSRIHPEAANRFCRGLIDMCNHTGMSFNPSPLIHTRQAQPGNIEAALRDVHRQSTEILSRQGQQGKCLQLLIVILPDVYNSYGRIKRICETDLGIISQCCLPKNVVRCNRQYLANVSLKINVKVGGTNTVLEAALRPSAIPFLNDKPTIIFGADVTHPSPGEDSSSSIAAVVASMDWPEVTKYRGLVSAQPHREEIIQDLYKEIHDPQMGTSHGGMIREHLFAFHRSTNRKPDRIIFYRDGVSEGQFSHVLLFEMDQIRKACQSIEDGYLPRVTFVVVQKRHHTRLFPTNRDSTDKSGNILPGTVVDTEICHPSEFDFYLCSHAGIQGTSRPAHYHVLCDENKFTADALQTLTNNLCYTYARCTRSVSIVPPAYYAHLAAFRARFYIEGESDAESSSAAGLNSRERSAVVRPLPKIRDNVKDVMFFC